MGANCKYATFKRRHFNMGMSGGMSDLEFLRTFIDGKSAWRQPNFNPLFAKTEKTSKECEMDIMFLLSEGKSVKEICSVMSVQPKTVLRIGRVNGRLRPEFEAARRKRASERSRHTMANQAMRKRLSEKHKENWAERKSDAFIPVQLPSYSELEKREGRYGGLWFGRGWWTPVEVAELTVLCNGKMEIGHAATIIGRPPSHLAHRARNIGLELPRDWYAIIAVEYEPKLKGISEIDIKLQYPYAPKESKNNNSEILEIYSFVPKGLAEWMKADICQEIMCDVLSGKVTINAFRKNRGLMQQYISRWKKQNMENAGYNTTSPYDIDDERPFDEFIASRAPIEDRYNASAEIRSNYRNCIRLPYIPPIQEEYVYRKELVKIRNEEIDNKVLAYHP